MASGAMPAAEVAIDEALVAGLLAEQHPELAARALSVLAFGWDNVVYRLGDDLCVRLPRRAVAVPLVEHEQRWLPSLAAHLDLPIPAPVRTGRPGAGYPWPWSVTPFFPGVTAAESPLSSSSEDEAADVLARFLVQLHTDAPPDAPPNPFRGVPLAERDDVLRQRLDALGRVVDRDRMLAVWADGLAAPRWAGPPQWLHGDLHSHNVVVHQGRVAAVIDFGDLTSGDPATDLVVAWALLEPVARQRFRHAVGVDNDTWVRGRAWALNLGLAIVASSSDHPLMDTVGRRILAAVLTSAT